MTEKQKEALTKLLDGPKLIGTLLGSKLVKMGYVEKTGGPGARGHMHVSITDAGRAALAA